MKRVSLVAAALALSASMASAQNRVQNGSFELNPCTPTFFCLNPTMPGWTNFGSVEQTTVGYWQAGDGVVSLDLNGEARGGVGQLVTGLTPGTTYDLSFLMSRNPSIRSTAGATLDVLWLGTAPASSTAFFALGTGTPFVFNLAPTLANMMWSQRGTQLVATSSTMFLGFRALIPSGGDAGPALDNVSLFAARTVPEPGTSALLAAGLGALLMMHRRRTRER